MAVKPVTLELVPMDPPVAAAAADAGAAPAPEALPHAPKSAAAPPQAEPSIEFVAPGAAPVDLDATQPLHTDRYLREATLQYQEGHVDAPLWTRALAQANGDKDAAAAIYVKSRAIALRMLERERRALRHGAPPPDTRPAEAGAMLPGSGGNDGARQSPAESPFVRFRIPIVAGAVLVPVLVAGWLLVGRLASPAVGEAAATRTAAAAVPGNKAPAGAPPAAPATAAAVVAAGAPTPPAAAPGTPRGPNPDLIKKIDELREAKNWNLLVLYLVEWTRQEPGSVDAWNQLRAGYVTLRQYDDALTAAKKAADLAPADPTMWARVGDVHVYRDDPAAALQAFEQAAARDAADVDSRLHIGMLQAQLGRSAESKAAFDGALAIAPGDPLAQCLRSGVAQITASPGDTYGRAREVRAIDGKCRGN